MTSVTKSDTRRKFPVDVIVYVILSKVERVLCVPSSLTFGNYILPTECINVPFIARYSISRLVLRRVRKIAKIDC